SAARKGRRILQYQGAAPRGRRRRKEAAPSSGGLRRAIGYLKNQRRAAFLAYSALVIATLAQLAVPTLVQNMTNSITNGVVAKSILAQPPFFQNLAISQMGISYAELQANAENAETWL